MNNLNIANSFEEAASLPQKQPGWWITLIPDMTIVYKPIYKTIEFTPFSNELCLLESQ